jgi:hypothetical protein
MRRNALAAACAALLIATSASAQTPNVWNGPDESRRGHLIGHALENFETAITEVCFPYLLQNAAANSWRRGERGIFPRPAGGVFDGLSTYQVGGSSASAVGVGSRGSGRECTVQPDSRMDADGTYASLQALIARMPVTMTESAQPMATSQVARRIAFCSPADGPQYAVLVSIPNERRGSQPPLLVTFLVMDVRDPRCDPPS